MALVVYDHGYRIQTPVDSLLPRGVVEQLTEMQPGRAISEFEVHPDITTPVQDRGARPRGLAQQQARKAYEETNRVNRRKTDKPDLTVDRIMTAPVISVPENCSVNDAWREMQRHRIQHLAVVSRSGRMVGILSERDLLRRHTPAPHQGPPIHRNSLAGGYPTQLIVATPETLVRQVTLIMFDRQVSCMPIIDAQGMPAGILTRSDLLPLIVNDRRFSNWA